MQAAILAAGMGKRLGDLTRGNTKCMVPVNGVPLIDRLLEQLSMHSLNRVVIVVGYEGQKLINYIGDRFDGRLKIEYVENPIYDKTNNIYSLALAKEKLAEDDTLLIESDLIFDERMFHLILHHPYPNLALVAKYEYWMDGTMVKIDEDSNIVRFVNKSEFQYSDVDSYYKTINIYKLSKEFSINKYIPFLEAYCKSQGNNEYYEQVLRVISFLDKSELKALPISTEKWYEIDDIQDLDIAEAIFAQGEEKLKKYYARYGGYWRFPHLLDFCFSVNPYFPTVRMKDEIKSHFDTLLTEYPSGLKVNSLIAGKCFGVNPSYVVPGNGAAELIKYLMEQLPGKLGVVYPTIEEYPNRRQKEDLEIFIPDNEDFSYSAADLIAYFSEHPVKILLLINPDNPSGNYISREELLSVAKWTKENEITLILDESFADFSDHQEIQSMLDNSILEQYPNMIVVKSISKSYGVPGLRLGIVASAHLERIEQIRKKVSIWNINSFAEFFMQIYTKHHSDYLSACRKIRQERSRFYQDLQQISTLRVIPSQANYFLCEVLGGLSSKDLAIELLEKYDILIKDCSSKFAFKGKNYVRIAVRNESDNRRFVDAMRSIMASN